MRSLDYSYLAGNTLVSTLGILQIQSFEFQFFYTYGPCDIYQPNGPFYYKTKTNPNPINPLSPTQSPPRFSYSQGQHPSFDLHIISLLPHLKPDNPLLHSISPSSTSAKPTPCPLHLTLKPKLHLLLKNLSKLPKPANFPFPAKSEGRAKVIQEF